MPASCMTETTVSQRVVNISTQERYDACYGFFGEGYTGESHAYRRTVEGEPCICGLRRCSGPPEWWMKS